MPDFTQISPKLHRACDGVWYSDEHSKISYPDQANQWCNEVEDASYWFEHRNRIIINTMRLFPPQGWLADIGGGNGFAAQALQRAGFEVVLIEPGKDGIRMAQERRDSTDHRFYLPGCRDQLSCYSCCGSFRYGRAHARRCGFFKGYS